MLVADRNNSMLDLRLVVQQLRMRWWLILLITGLAAFIGFLIATRPVPYEAHATLSIEPQTSGVSELSMKDVEIEIGRIRSWTTVSRVLEEMNYYGMLTPKKEQSFADYLDHIQYFLATKKKYRPVGKPPVAIDVMKFPERFHNQALTLTIEADQHYTLTDAAGETILHGAAGHRPEAPESIRFFISSIAAEPGSQWNIVPKSAEDMTESVLTYFRIRRRSNNKFTTLIDYTFFSGDPYFARHCVEHLLDDYITQSDMRHVHSERNALNVLREELSDYKRSLDESEDALNRYLTTINVADVESEHRGLLELRLSHEQSLRTVQLRKTELNQIFSAEHPSVIATSQKERTLQKKLETINQKLADLSAIQAKLQQLNRAIEANKQAYQTLNEQVITRTLYVSELENPAHIINEPRIVRRNLLNKAIQVVAMSVLMGLIIASCIIILQANSAARILRKRVQLPDAPHLVVHDLTHHHDQEREHTLGEISSELAYLIKRKTSVTVMISSLNDTVERSLFTRDLAYHFAPHYQEKTLLIDTMLEGNHLSDQLDITMPTKSGVADIMAGLHIDTDVVQPLKVSPCYFMQPGTLTTSTVMFKDHQRFHVVLKQFSGLFPCVILDIPHWQSLPNPEALYSGASVVIHIVKRGTAIHIVEQAIERLNQHAEQHEQVMHKIVFL